MVCKTSAYICRNSPRLQIARIWIPLAPNWRNRSPNRRQKLFLNFSKNYTILSILRLTFFFRQFGDLAPARGARSPKMAIRTTRDLGLSNHSHGIVYKPLNSKIAFSISPYFQESAMVGSYKEISNWALIYRLTSKNLKLIVM